MKELKIQQQLRDIHNSQHLLIESEPIKLCLTKIKIK